MSDATPLHETPLGRQMAGRHGWGAEQWGTLRLLADEMHAGLAGRRTPARRAMLMAGVYGKLAEAFGVDAGLMADCFDARRPPKGEPEGSPRRKAQDVAYAFTLVEAGRKPPEPIGDTVARLRGEAGLSQYALAERAGISRQALIHIEGGTAAPSLETARRLCEALGVSLAVFDPPAR